MGTVDVGWRRESGFERLVAIKRLHPHYAEDRELVAMLHDEARVAGTIRHANVVSVLDVGEDDQGPFLVMELVEGQSLSQLLTHAAADGVLPLQIALRIIRHVAAGLHAAHETRDAKGKPLSVVHRDVSPQNVLVGYDGIARISDFGVAKALGASTQTEAGLVKGKLRYMAPEQLTFGDIDRRTDLFALGLVLYEVIAGHHPYEGSSDEIARAIVKGKTAPDLGEECPELPSALVELVFRMLALDPALRPQDADEVGRALDALIADEVAREGVIEIADYLMAHFRTARDELSDRIRVAVSAASVELPLDELEDEPRPAKRLRSDPPTKLELPRPRGDAQLASPESPPSSSRRAPWAWIAAGALAVVLALALLGVYGPLAATPQEGAAAPRAAVVGHMDAPPAATPLVADDEDRSAEHDTAREAEGERALEEPSRAPESSGATQAIPRGRRPARRGARDERAGSASRVGAWGWDHGSP